MIAVVFLGAASCGRKPEPAAKEEPKGAGVGDFVEYATGAAPVRHGSMIKRKAREYADKHNKELEEALGE